MAGITLAQRDLPGTRARLGDWFEQKFGEPVMLSELEAANRASGWSSESLKFTAQRADGAVNEYVVRIPPSGGGIFAVPVSWSLLSGIAFGVTLLWLGWLVHRVERREDVGRGLPVAR